MRESDLDRVWPVPKGKYNHPLPQPFWNKLAKHCTTGEQLTAGRDEHCEFITSPHNTNLGGGNKVFPASFLDPYNTDDAKQHRHRYGTALPHHSQRQQLVMDAGTVAHFEAHPSIR